MTITSHSSATARSSQVTSHPAPRTLGRQVITTLLTRCAHQDEEALNELYQLTRRWVYGLVSRRTTSAAAADDATVAVYATIWRRASRWTQSDQPALVWITAIAFETTNAPTPPIASST